MKFSTKRLPMIFLLAGIWFTSFCLTVQAQPAGDERVSVLVHLNSGANRGLVHAYAQSEGASVHHEYKILPNLVNIRNLPVQALEALRQLPGVTRLEEDFTVYAHLNDSTPLIRARQSDINAAGFSADGSGIRICVVDTGIDSDHIMYAGSRIDTAAGWDFANNDPDPEDDYGHGAHVAGIALGGTGITAPLGCGGASEEFQGVAPEATLIGVKVLKADGTGTASDVIAGIDHCADSDLPNGPADIINLSLGGIPVGSVCDGDTLAAAANAAVDAGVVVVASSGNNDVVDGMSSPACGSKVISVAATYDEDYPSCEVSNTEFTFCTLSMYGLCWVTCTDTFPQLDQHACFSNGSNSLDISAPGCVTFSADAGNSPDGIVGYCGTSMSAPHVAGEAALLLSANPALTPAQIRTCIQDGAVDLGAPGYDTVYGWGRIDVLNSLALCADPGPPVCEPTEDPEVTCSDGIDNDCDLLIDGEDPDCSISCVPTHSKEKGPRCSDGLDNDCDELTDGADPDCGGVTGCVPEPEICDDGIDNDCDGLIDLNDSDCGAPSCKLAGRPCRSNDQCCSGICASNGGKKLVCQP